MRVLGRRWRPTPGGGAKTGGDSVGMRHGGVAAVHLGLWHLRWSTSSATVVKGEVLGFGGWWVRWGVGLCYSWWLLGSVAVGVDFMGFGSWWVMGLAWVSFFFGNGKHNWMTTFLDQVEKWQRQLSGGENTMVRDFFLGVIFSSSGLTTGCFRPIDVCSDTKYDAGLPK